MTIENGRQLAAKMLEEGRKVPEIEAALASRGIDNKVARVIVDEIVGIRVEELAADKQSPPCRWRLVTLGVVFCVASFAGMYVALVSLPEGVILEPGPVRSGLRGAIIGVGGAAALVGIRIAYAELMKLGDRVPQDDVLH